MLATFMKYHNNGLSNFNSIKSRLRQNGHSLFTFCSGSYLYLITQKRGLITNLRPNILLRDWFFYRPWYRATCPRLSLSKIVSIVQNLPTTTCIPLKIQRVKSEFLSRFTGKEISAETYWTNRCFCVFKGRWCLKTFC